MLPPARFSARFQEYLAQIRREIEEDLKFLESHPKTATQIDPHENFANARKRILDLNKAAENVMRGIWNVKINSTVSDPRLYFELFRKEYDLALRFIGLDTLEALKEEMNPFGRRRSDDAEPSQEAASSTVKEEGDPQPE